MNNKTIILLIVLILVIVLAVLGIVLGITYYRGNTQHTSKSMETYSFTLEEMYCNIKESKRILRAVITVEANNESTIKNLQEKEFLIRDDINKIIRSKTEEDLEGKEGQISLQDEIKNSLINLFNDSSITNIYFNELIIQ